MGHSNNIKEIPFFIDKKISTRSSKFTLDEEESKHAYRVLRLGKGDHIAITNGKGDLFTAKIIESSMKYCYLSIEKHFSEYKKRDDYLHIAISPIKNMNRLEWFLEKATEFGIDEITPVVCERSIRKSVKHKRLEKIIESAVKQSQKAYIPVLNSITVFESFVLKNHRGCKMIAHCREDHSDLLMSELTTSKGSHLVCIGPEGDFTKKEILLAKSHSFHPISLGAERLRTETAALSVVTFNYWVNSSTLGAK